MATGVLQDVEVYIGDYPLKLDFTVLEMGGEGQILLGEDFLDATKAIMDFGKGLSNSYFIRFYTNFKSQRNLDH